MIFANAERYADLFSVPGIWGAAGKSASAFRDAGKARPSGNGGDGGLGTGIPLVWRRGEGHQRTMRLRLAGASTRRAGRLPSYRAAFWSSEVESRDPTIVPREVAPFR